MSESQSIGVAEENPPTTKICTTCGVEKALSSFSPSKTARLGRQPKCKSCNASAQAAYRAANPEAVREQRTRSARKHRDKMIQYHRERRATPEHKKKSHVQKKAWEKRYPERRRAQTAVRIAVKNGVLSRAACCRHCGLECATEASHNDYSNQLEIEWLCHSCHGTKDAKLRREGKL